MSQDDQTAYFHLDSYSPSSQSSTTSCIFTFDNDMDDLSIPLTQDGNDIGDIGWLERRPGNPETEVKHQLRIETNATSSFSGSISLSGSYSGSLLEEETTESDRDVLKQESADALTDFFRRNKRKRQSHSDLSKDLETENRRTIFHPKHSTRRWSMSTHIIRPFAKRARSFCSYDVTSPFHDQEMETPITASQPVEIQYAQEREILAYKAREMENMDRRSFSPPPWLQDHTKKRSKQRLASEEDGNQRRLSWDASSPVRLRFQKMEMDQSQHSVAMDWEYN